jgi:hypothetical protein
MLGNLSQVTNLINSEAKIQTQEVSVQNDNTSQCVPKHVL